jgi:putative heme-binding domain-containing protein
MAQIAATARRAPTGVGLSIAGTVARRDQFAGDPHIPLLVWWAIEHHLSDDGEAALELFRDSTFWRHAIVRETLIERVMRRYASDADNEGFLRCAELLKVAPDPDAKRRLVEGFAKAIEGRSLGTLPDALSAQLARVASELPLAMKLRIGAEGALDDALAALLGETTKGAERSVLIHALGAVRPPNRKVAEVLLENLASNKEQEVQLAAIAALSGHRSEMGEASRVFAALESERQAVRDAAAAFLVSELRGARQLVELAGEGKFELRADGVALIETLRAHGDATVNAALDRVAATSGRTDNAEMVRVRSLVAPGGGVPKRGEALFLARCSACHEMFGNGGAIGPDLTSYQRDDREALLLAIIDPGAEIREGYEHTVVKLREGGLLSGFRIADDRDAVVLRDLAGARRVVEKSAVDSIEVTASSLMPAGLLAGLSDDQVRDLFAYLRSTTPPY